MNISFEGIGEWCATFGCGAGVSEGITVKAGADGTAAKCSAQDGFCGVVRAVARDGKACSVQLGGLAKVGYSGETAPSVGYGKLSADGAGDMSVTKRAAADAARRLDALCAQAWALMRPYTKDGGF